ncbi:MAG: hypothetical protein JST22_19385 [Bacteroidetes bacterium]|nr:hypothetical protein [Bacteroidota bacterium]
MLTGIRNSATAVLVAALFLIVVAASVSHAAVCTSVTVTSNLVGSIKLTLVDASGSLYSQTVTGGGAATVVTPPAGFVIAGVQGATGINHFFPAPPPNPSCLMQGGAQACIMLLATAPPPGVYCGTVCYDNLACTMTINPCPSNTCGP